MKFVLDRGPYNLKDAYAGLVEIHVGSPETFKDLGGFSRECRPHPSGIVTIFHDKVWEDECLSTRHGHFHEAYAEVDGRVAGQIRMCYDTTETFCIVIKPGEIPPEVRHRFNQKGVMPWEEV